MKDKSLSDIKFSGPGTYHIRVMGEVDHEIWDYFSGEMEQKKDQKGQLTTSLKIHVQDQAELSGLIKLLYEWQLVLLLVKREMQDEEIEA